MLEANKLGALGVMISDRMEDALQGLSPSAAALLSTLHFKPGTTASQLADICAIKQPTAVRLIDGLERRELIARQAQDGRMIPLVVTTKGHEVIKALQTARLAAMETLLAPLESDERAQFAEMLDRILAGATTNRAFARTTCRLCEHDLCAPGCCPIGNRASD